MKIPPRRTKETVHLWFAIAIIIALSGYRLSVELGENISSAVAPITNWPVAIWLSNIFLFYLLAVLWFAYRSWADTITRSRELEEVIADIAPEMLMVINREREIVMCNQGIMTIFGYEEEEVVGKKTDLLYFDRRMSGDSREVFNRIQKLGFHSGFATGKRKDGSHVPLEIITGELRRQPGAVLSIRDITERKKSEDRLIEAKESAEEATSELRRLEHARDSLTHMIVHDLKSPLTAITGYLAILQRSTSDRLSEKETGFLAESTRLTTQLGEMIHCVLDVSRLESHRMPIHRQKCDLGELADEAIATLGPDAAEHRVTRKGAAATVWVNADPELIRRVVTNLVDNALRHTQDCPIHVAVEHTDGTGKVSVIDRGPGIPEEYHERIFERFGQVAAQQYSTGLGLTFCKLTIEEHGGDIGVESKPGKGSNFWFSLPIHQG